MGRGKPTKVKYSSWQTLDSANEFKTSKQGLHPSKQLQVILNKIGNEGWKLEITERIGNLLMFIFIKEKLEN